MQPTMWISVTTNRIVCPVECDLIFAYMMGDGIGVADAQLYDGDSAAGRLITKLQATTNDYAAFNPREPVRCNSGIFVDVGSNVANVFVQYRRIG